MLDLTVGSCLELEEAQKEKETTLKNTSLVFCTKTSQGSARLSCNGSSWKVVKELILAALEKSSFRTQHCGETGNWSHVTLNRNGIMATCKNTTVMQISESESWANLSGGGSSCPDFLARGLYELSTLMSMFSLLFIFTESAWSHVPRMKPWHGSGISAS